MKPGATTRLLGVIGHPIGHSLSPQMHNASFEASGLDYLYVAMDVRPGYLPAAVDGLRALGFRGFNVTMPHKEAILPLLDQLDGPASISGSVNTVVVEEGRLRGTNTDGGGFVEACEESGVRFAGATVLLVGAGGTAAIAAKSNSGGPSRLAGHIRLRLAAVTVPRPTAASSLTGPLLPDPSPSCLR